MTDRSRYRRDVRLLLGGGIGSGKSTVGAFLARRGATVVEADRIGHEVIEPGGEAHRVVATRWPGVVVDGRIDRTALAGIVFSDPGALAELEALTHPAIIGRIAALLEAPGAFVVEVPVILDMGGEWLRVFVDAPEAVRLQRAVARGGEEDDVRRRIAAQPDREAWLGWADRIIFNGGALDRLEEPVDRLWDSLTGDDGRPGRP